jgi:hypothetical protein
VHGPLCRRRCFLWSVAGDIVYTRSPSDCAQWTLSSLRQVAGKRCSCRVACSACMAVRTCASNMSKCVHFKSCMFCRVASLSAEAWMSFERTCHGLGFAQALFDEPSHIEACAVLRLCFCGKAYSMHSRDASSCGSERMLPLLSSRESLACALRRACVSAPTCCR